MYTKVYPYLRPRRDVPDERRPAAVVTSLNQRRVGTLVELTATASYPGQPSRVQPGAGLWFRWWRDGRPLLSSGGRPTIRVHVDLAMEITVTASVVRHIDMQADPPLGYDIARLVSWFESVPADPAPPAAYYELQRYLGPGTPSENEWERISEIAEINAWQYADLTRRLILDENAQFRIVPVDARGNRGTPLTLSQQMVKANPLQPNVSYEYSANTGQVTVSEVV